VARGICGEHGRGAERDGGAVLSAPDGGATAELCGAGPRHVASGSVAGIAGSRGGVSAIASGEIVAGRRMRYRSTSGKAPLTSLRGAVLRGLAPDGGLYMPVEIARHSAEELEEFRRLPFTEVCYRVVRPFAGAEVPDEMLWQIVSEVINFPVKLVSLSPGLHILELFHGPTLAFKDFGARFMARLMAYFVREETRLLTVLVATSGDTGSAVAHGFLGVPGIRVVILYPSKRISEAQEKQFTTLGENITALEV